MPEPWVEELLNKSFGPTGHLALPLRTPRTMSSTASSYKGRPSYYPPSRTAPTGNPQTSSSRASFSESLYPPHENLASSTSKASSVLSNPTPSLAQSKVFTEPCVVCSSNNKQTFTCVQCNNDAFCDDCWSKERPHRPGAVGMDGLPHEKTNRQVVERLRQILDPYRSTDEQQNAHRSDEDTTWFGIARDSANLPIFQDYGRYAAIMTESQSPEVNVRYPQLVSFIGQTGAGKSTLIKMLIDNQLSATDFPTNRRSFPSPVTGSINDNIPTSGDVHLYSDPATYFTATPLLYADCEGLDGGENIPRGARFKHRDNSVPPTSRSSSSNNDPNFRKKIRKVAHSSQRDIVWATTPETRKREYAVTQLYPRLLYTFSDVVVFVLRNSKVFESTVLEKLLDWASASIEKSLNQPALPHAIIVLNATDNSIETRQWDVQQATEILMSDIALAISRVPRYEEYALLWRSRGKIINTTKDLLECFYSSVTVVRIPTRGRYMLIDEQISKLHTEIKRSCKSAYLTKRRVRMLSNGDKLQVYLQSAFDHFSQNLDAPFDFVKEAIKINPIPRDFRGNILKLAIAIRDHNSFPDQDDGPRIFEDLSQMVASCVLLDVVRHSLLGTAAQLFEDHYADFCDDALFDFCSMYWPCNFKNRHGRCCNMKLSHNTKGHQNNEGKIIASGEYQSNFQAEVYIDDWYENIRRNLDGLHRALQDILIRLPHMAEQQAVSDLHRTHMNDFYRLVGQASDYVSHSTCFSCLRELPEHPLPCGHVLCTPCVEDYGRRSGKTVIRLEACPLHVRETTWLSPWEIRVKPQYAGVRVLSLDGGGVRGIVELEVLRAIERALGGDLPIQGFFDLIVGTSTGGIIALGLGVENWSVDSCINKFTDLVRHAFAPREFHGVWGFEHLATARHGSKYRTRPFEKALQEAFAEKPLFGGQDVQDKYMIKVAVTSTTYVDQHPVLLTNYNRPEPQNFPSYKFERLDRPAIEMRTWEAARATSAAPPYFKPFTKNETKCSYLDGALYHNNPVWVAHHERRLIWSDVSTQQPDIFLSIGTGHHGPDPKNRPLETRRLRRSTGESNASEYVPQPEGNPRSTTALLPFTGQLWNTAASRLDNILNCTKIWDNFRLDVLEPYSGYRRRYIRLNPDLRFKVPSLDEVDRLDDLRTAVGKEMQNNTKIREIAHRLIASTFFFEKVDSSTKENQDRFECKGFICCRFSNSSHELKALGRFLHRYLTADFTPYFVIQEDRKIEMSRKVPISEQCISDMIVRGRFEIDRIRITASKQLSTTTISLCLQESPYPHSSDSHLPISGFPRTLMAEDTIHKVASHTASSRNSGSFINRPHRRRRQDKKRPSSGETSPPEPSSLRRVKSQSNLKQPKVNPGQKAFPENPEDVKDWIKRRNSVDTIKTNGDSPALTIFELADTSQVRARSQTPLESDLNFSALKKEKFIYR